MRNRRDMMPLVVREVVRETPSIVSLHLEDPAGAPLPAWQPGAHVDVQLVTRHERQYSLCGDPSDAHRYRIAVQQERLSRGASQYIHTYLRPGSRVYVRPPRNLFPLGEADGYLLLAAGIGITPILAMARHLAAAGEDWRMVYAVRHRSDAAFTDELGKWGDRVRVHVSSEAGRLDLPATLAGLTSGTDVYACGPSSFSDDLLALGSALPARCRLHTERFEPKPREFRPNEAFTVTCARSEKVVEVHPRQTMLTALQVAGLELPGSCHRGVCGSCALQVLDGRPEHRDSLTVDEDSTTIYPCVSRSLTPSLVVDA